MGIIGKKNIRQVVNTDRVACFMPLGLCFQAAFEDSDEK